MNLDSIKICKLWTIQLYSAVHVKIINKTENSHVLKHFIKYDTIINLVNLNIIHLIIHLDINIYMSKTNTIKFINDFS